MSSEADTVVYAYLKVQHAYTKLASKFKKNRQLSDAKMWVGAPSLVELIQFYKDNKPAATSVTPEPAAESPSVPAPAPIEAEVTVVEPVQPVAKVKKGKKRKLSVTVVENKCVSEIINVEETPVEETPVEETPVEETPVEETPVEETPVEVVKPAEVVQEAPVAVEEVTQPSLSKKDMKKRKKAEKLAKKKKGDVVVISDSPTAETNGIGSPVVEETPVEHVNGGTNGGMVVAAASGEEDECEPPKKKAKKVKRGQSESFRRVKEEEIEIKKKELCDNAFEAKQGADGYGFMANQVLKFTKGKSFRHEKTKKKRGTYKGGEINMGVTSIKFDSD